MATRTRDIKDIQKTLEDKYNDTVVPVERVMNDYMGISTDTYKKKRAQYVKDLHFKVFQMGGNKSPYFVSTKALAEYIAGREDLGI